MKKYYFFILGMLLATGAFSQSISSYVITSTGSSIMSADGALYISIGEPMSTEITDGEIMISQGFLNVTVAGSVSTDDLLTETVNAYPNPTGNRLTIEIPEFNGVYTYTLSNLMGETIKKDKLGNSTDHVEFSDLHAGTYFMTVTKDNKSSKTLKIIKI